MHFNIVFHYKPSILGYPYFWKHPYYPPGNNHIPIASWKLESSQPLDVTSILPLEEGSARKGSLGCSRPVSVFPTETGSHVDFLGQNVQKDVKIITANDGFFAEKDKQKNPEDPHFFL